MSQNTPTWVLVCTAAGSILGPLAAYLIAVTNIKALFKNTRSQIRSTTEVAKLQIHSNVISQNRQKWVDALREDLSAFVTELEVIKEKIRNSTSTPTNLQELSKGLFLVYNRLRFRLNPDKQDHVDIIKCMENILSDVTASDVRAKSENLVLLGQRLIRKEWVRIKSGG